MNTVPLRILIEAHKVVDDVLLNDNNIINLETRLQLAGIRGRLSFYISEATKDIALEVTQ